MVRLLKLRKVEGLIVHKIDRSARNLRDWAELGELIDSGVQVRFANDDLDLHSRGGRLAADIQAVVAADYVRNLREEAKKGLYGRLKQGIWPFAAPVGYLDRGGGKPKEIDPAAGPLVLEAFDLYASGRYSTEALRWEMSRRGLKNRLGKAFSKNAMREMLHNPFYIGILLVRRNGQSFLGIHDPLVSPKTFARVAAILSGKSHVYVLKHDFRFRRSLRCRKCGRDLTGEKQRGIIYYRCHKVSCLNSIREDTVDLKLRASLSTLGLAPEERAHISRWFEEHRAQLKEKGLSEKDGIALRLANLKAKLVGLVDLAAEGSLDRDLFEERKRAFLGEQRDLEERLATIGRNPSAKADTLQKKFEQADAALLSYEIGNDPIKREILSRVSSNRTVGQKDVVVELSFPYDDISKRNSALSGGDSRAQFRSVGEVSNKATSAETLQALDDLLSRLVDDQRLELLLEGH